jgi:hypothetical protein
MLISLSFSNKNQLEFSGKILSDDMFFYLTSMTKDLS